MTATLEHDGILYRPESALRRNLRALRHRAGRGAMATAAAAVAATGRVLRAKATPAVAHVQEHAYTLIGFGLIDAAVFTHSLFAGLLVTGISWIVFEWKVT